MQLSGRIVDFREILGSGFKPKPIAYAILASIVAIIFYISFASRVELYFLAGVAALPLLFLVPLYPKIWLYSLIITTPAFFYTSDEGVSALDILLGLYYASFLAIWLVWMLGVKKEKLVLNFGDWIIFFFFIMLIFNSIVAGFNDVDFWDWVREYARYMIILLYLPIRHYIKDRKDLKQLLKVLTISAVVAFIVHFGFYYSLYQEKVTYAYQLARSIRNGLSFLLAVNLVATLFLFKTDDKKLRFMLFLFTLISLLALLTTFARTFWMIYLGLSVIIFFSLSMKRKMYFISLIIVVSAIVIGFAQFYLGSSSKLFISALERRFTSSTMGKKDPSLQSRLEEWNTVIELIKDNPLGGNGLMKNFHFYNFLDKSTKTTNNIHNGYLLLVYRLGIPLTLCFLIFIVFYFYKSGWLYFNSEDVFYKMLALACFLVIFSTFLANLTSAQYTYRDGIFVTVYAVGLIGILDNLNRKRISINE